MTVAAILRHKGSFVATITPHGRVAEAVLTLADRRIGALVVADAQGDVVGILSERDIIYALAEEVAAALERPAAALMTTEVITATGATTYDEAFRAMTQGASVTCRWWRAAGWSGSSASATS